MMDIHIKMPKCKKHIACFKYYVNQNHTDIRNDLQDFKLFGPHWENPVQSMEGGWNVFFMLIGKSVAVSSMCPTSWGEVALKGCRWRTCVLLWKTPLFHTGVAPDKGGKGGQEKIKTWDKERLRGGSTHSRRDDRGLRRTGERGAISEEGRQQEIWKRGCSVTGINMPIGLNKMMTEM